jgi:hypothetical protein
MRLQSVTGVVLECVRAEVNGGVIISAGFKVYKARLPRTQTGRPMRLYPHQSRLESYDRAAVRHSIACLKQMGTKPPAVSKPSFRSLLKVDSRADDQ